MSEYFRVLKRMERDRTEKAVRRPMVAVAGSKRNEGSAPPARPVREEPIPAARQEPAPAPAPATLSQGGETAAAFAALFDNIRVRTAAHPARTLVFAGVSAGDPTHAVISGLRAQAERHGLTVSSGKITHLGSSRPTRHTPSPDTSESTDRNAPDVGLESHVSAVPLEGTSWAQDVERAADLVLIEAAPLDRSIDAALLGRAADGLVIVARTGVTARDALMNAGERARAVGCRTLGIVLQAAPDRTPQWLRRLLSRLQPPMPA